MTKFGYKIRKCLELWKSDIQVVRLFENHFDCLNTSLGQSIWLRIPRTTNNMLKPIRLCELLKSKRNKMILKKSDDLYIALLSYRATPLTNGNSPAELLMGRKLQTLLPIAPKQLKPKLPNFRSLRENEKESKLKRIIRDCFRSDFVIVFYWFGNFI
jgi:hypothetical protein